MTGSKTARPPVIGSASTEHGEPSSEQPNASNRRDDDPPSMNEFSFTRAELWPRLVSTTQRALRRGSLRPIQTTTRYVEDGGVEFLVRAVDRLAEKEKDANQRTEKTSGSAGNPFLPPSDPDLYVGDASSSHVYLLNKFQVIDHHLLIVTRDFQPQESPLELGDFQALWRCLGAYDGLGFYNGGKVAGASQPHKHLQVIPLPLSTRGLAVPIEAAFESWVKEANSLRGDDRPGGTDRLPFRHALARFPWDLWQQPDKAASTAHRLYRESLATVGMDADASDPGAYNLLVTRRWMLLVPRSREHFESISLNALAFAGSLFVRDPSQLKRLEQEGPLAALSATTFPG